MSHNIKLLRNYLLYILVGLSICIVGITGVFADTYNPTSKLQYYEYYDEEMATGQTTFYENSYQYNNNIIPPLMSGYAQKPYAISLILGGTFESGNTYSFKTRLRANISANSSFRFYYQEQLYLAWFARMRYNNNTVTCNLDQITANKLYEIVCNYQPTANSSQVVLSMVNYDYVNNGYLTYDDTGTYFKFESLDVQVYSNSSGVIIDQNNTIINQNQQIIDTQNQNTQEIIDNQNSNTQKEIDSQKVCIEYDSSNIETDGYTLGDGGAQYQNANYGISNYISLTKDDTLTLINTTTNSHRSCFYNTNKQVISCFREANYSNNSKITIPDNTAYFRFTVNKAQNKPTFSICRNGNQALNDNLNDDNTSGATNEASDFFSSFNTETFGLTSIITAPLNLIRSVLSSTCTELQLPLPYLDNKKLTLPCMSTIYSEFFGSFFTIYQTITYGIIAYWVCVRIFNQVKDFKNPEHDEIEVMDL